MSDYRYKNCTNKFRWLQLKISIAWSVHTWKKRQKQLTTKCIQVAFCAEIVCVQSIRISRTKNKVFIKDYLVTLPQIKWTWFYSPVWKRLYNLNFKNNTTTWKLTRFYIEKKHFSAKMLQAYYGNLKAVNRQKPQVVESCCVNKVR